LKMDIQNIANCKGMVDMYYSNVTDRIEKIHQLPMLPVFIYTVEF
jgi:hypothetical protein